MNSPPNDDFRFWNFVLLNQNGNVVKTLNLNPTCVCIHAGKRIHSSDVNTTLRFWLSLVLSRSGSRILRRSPSFCGPKLSTQQSRVAQVKQAICGWGPGPKLLGIQCSNQGKKILWKTVKYLRLIVCPVTHCIYQSMSSDGKFTFWNHHCIYYHACYSKLFVIKFDGHEIKAVTKTI